MSGVCGSSTDVRSVCSQDWPALTDAFVATGFFGTPIMYRETTSSPWVGGSKEEVTKELAMRMQVPANSTTTRMPLREGTSPHSFTYPALLPYHLLVDAPNLLQAILTPDGALSLSLSLSLSLFLSLSLRQQTGGSLDSARSRRCFSI
jgi:hypothetical protein